MLTLLQIYINFLFFVYSPQFSKANDDKLGNRIECGGSAIDRQAQRDARFQWITDRKKGTKKSSTISRQIRDNPSLL